MPLFKRRGLAVGQMNRKYFTHLKQLVAPPADLLHPSQFILAIPNKGFLKWRKVSAMTDDQVRLVPVGGHTLNGQQLLGRLARPVGVTRTRVTVVIAPDVELGDTVSSRVFRHRVVQLQKLVLVAWNHGRIHGDTAPVSSSASFPQLKRWNHQSIRRVSGQSFIVVLLIGIEVAHNT